MATKWYFRHTVSSDAPADGELSTSKTADAALTGTGFEDLSLLLTAGASVQQFDVVWTTGAGVKRGYAGRFTSPPLVAGSVAAGAAWDIGFAAELVTGNNQCTCSPTIYFYRPSTAAVVGYVRDNSTDAGELTSYFTSISGGGKDESGTLNTPNITGVTWLDGDVLVCEFWHHGARVATNITPRWFFNGTTEPVGGGTTTADCASYLIAPADMVLYEPGTVIPQIVMRP